MKSNPIRILLVNPWIHDFAAYDFWAKPAGLLMLGAILRNLGISVDYIDCLDRFHPRARQTDKHARYGRGPYAKTPIPKPEELSDVPRQYSRYGIPPAWFREDIRLIPRPDAVLVTSVMTYWYPGVQETIREIRAAWPHMPVFLGGIYASLCQDHAIRHSGADQVFSGRGETILPIILKQLTGQDFSLDVHPDDLDSLPYPAYDLQHSIAYVPLLTSLGCPFSCDYCASSFLYPKRRRRSPESVMEEILFWHTRFHVVDFVFYDDALLIDAERHAIPLFEMIIRSGLNQTIRFHTPNAVHIREITMETAGLMYQAGFKTLRLGLETTAFDPDKRLDVKVSRNEFHQAVTCLKNAGFQSGDVGAYLLAGCPGQPVSDVEEAIHIVKETGITPVPAYYSPIPHTALWPQAVRFSRYPLEDDPIYTNNAILPCSLEPFSWETIRRLKEKCESDSFRHAVFIGPD